MSKVARTGGLLAIAVAEMNSDMGRLALGLSWFTESLEGE
jgi:hypothetical protein